jgi:hypothetical protein
MRRQRQFWLQTGVCQPSYSTRAIPRCVLRVAMLPSTTFCVSSAHKGIEGWRESSSTAALGAHPAPEWRDLLQGFDTLFRVKQEV